jgi:GntR family transcriptional repressor for pyruvate dehydrogenase complex
MLWAVPFEKLEFKKRSARIADAILNAIRQGQYKASDRLPSERVLAEQMGVSRPSIREAISALELVGVLESRVGDGTYVLEADFLKRGNVVADLLERSESPFEVLDARRILESNVAWFAAERATEADVTILQRALAKMEQAINAANFEVYLQSNIELHMGLVQSLHNDYVAQELLPLIETMSNQLSGQMRRKFYEEDAGQQILMIHQSIVKAIADRDSKTARETMLEHFESVELHLGAADTG